MPTIFEKLVNPAAIRIALKSKNVTQRNIAVSCEVSEAFVSQVITGDRGSKSVEKAIAEAIGEPVEVIFPDRYPAPLKRGEK